MCGFIGAVLREPDANIDLLRAGPLLARRGPDSLKRWTSADGRTSLLHARLAIVDADGPAHQPMTDARTGTTIAFNGEIYNYEELRAQLKGYPYRTRSDTEVILAAYRCWGIDALSRLCGTFSLALVDGGDGRVYVARDAVGKKPLFLANWPRATLFGSTATALVAAVGRPVALDRSTPREYWADGHVHPARSVFSDCRPLLPGEVIEIRPDGRQRSFRITPAHGDLDEGAPAREQLRQLLGTSVQRRLRNNPAPVALLSGGIDSTVVTHAIQQQASVQALTLGALVPLTLDERYARYAARRLRLPLQTVSPRIGRMEDEVDFSLGLQDEPLGMMSFLPLALLLRAAKPYGQILFSGDGGDEVFLGYGRPQDWTAASPSLGGHSVPCGPTVPAWMSPWGASTVTTALVGHMFTKLDRASAEQGIEVRCPLLDWDVMTFARGLDPGVLFGPGRTKHLLKDQLEAWPSWFLDRPKTGFAYHLRWAWVLRRFSGLRDRIDRDAQATFEPWLAAGLRAPARTWRTRDIWHHFPQAWKLLAWSAFLARLSRHSPATIQTATA